MPIRSYLYAPGNRPDLMAKLARSGAHAAILDLEDAVPAAEKPRARETVGAFLRSGPGLPAFVRLNAGGAALEDLSGLPVTGLTGVLVPKAEDPALLAAIGDALSVAESHEGWPAGSVIVQPLIESVAGMYALDALARATPRVRRFAFGAGDFVRDLGAVPTDGRVETLHARQHIVARSRFLRLQAPVAHVFTRIRDLEGLRRACAEDRALGFGARSCIHPSQVSVVNAAFAPAEAELVQARAVLAAYAEATAAGRGSLLLEDGTFIDEAVALRAADILDAAIP